jgi:hypothetical protein
MGETMLIKGNLSPSRLSVWEVLRRGAEQKIEIGRKKEIGIVDRGKIEGKIEDRGKEETMMRVMGLIEIVIRITVLAVDKALILPLGCLKMAEEEQEVVILRICEALEEIGLFKI